MDLSITDMWVFNQVTSHKALIGDLNCNSHICNSNSPTFNVSIAESIVHKIVHFWHSHKQTAPLPVKNDSSLKALEQPGSSYGC